MLYSADMGTLPKETASNAVTDWVHSYSDELYRWAYYKTSNRELAEDLVQETFLSAYDKHASYRQQGNPRTWLFSILNNKIIDHYRSARSQKMVTASTLNEEEPPKLFDQHGMWNTASITEWDKEPQLLDNPAFLQVFETCMEALPDRWKAVTKAKYVHNKKGEEICKDMDLSPSNLWQIVHRSKLQLKKCLDRHWNRHD